MKKKVLFLWVLSLNISCWIYAAKEIDYMAILLTDQKIGSAIHERVVEGNVVTTTESLSMTLGRGGQAVTVTSKEIHTETIHGQPLGFEMSMITSGIEQKTSGSIKGGKLSVNRQVLGVPQELIMDWPMDALLSEGMLQFQQKRGLHTGDSFEVKIFRPDLLVTVTAIVEIGQKKKVPLLLGQSEELTEVKTTMQVQQQQIPMTSYVDDGLKAKKTVVPMMGMMLEMVVCDEEFAKKEDAIIDFLEKLSIASPAKLSNLNKINSITYTIKSTAANGLDVPESSCQSVKKSKDRMVVTVNRITPPKDIPFPYKGKDKELLEALTSNDYIQCDNNKIIDMAKHAAGDAKDALTASHRIEAFVDGYIKKKDLSVGYASAAEVAQNQQGDCSEHAVLVAAMCRSLGIPSRIVCGVVYADSFLSKESIFGGHMWTEVYLGNGWYGLDATRSEKQRVGPGHIALVYGSGEPTDFFGLVNTLGCFEIEKVSVKNTKDNKKNPKPSNNP